MVLVEQLPAVTYLKRRSVPFEIVPHEPAHSARAEARSIGLPSTFVLKSIVVRVGEHLALAVVPADRMVDMRVLDELLGEETELATEEEVKSAFPDYELGALPPLPGLLGLKALVDPLVFEHEKVAFADGKRTESLLASPIATFRDEEAYVVPISREHEVFGGWS